MNEYFNFMCVCVYFLYECSVCMYTNSIFLHMCTCVCMHGMKKLLHVIFTAFAIITFASASSCLLILIAGVKGISKILTTETIQYPDIKALELSKFFIPKSVFRNTDIVEYKDGLYTYITGSKYTSTLQHKVQLDHDYRNSFNNGQNRSQTRRKSNNNNDGPLVPFEP